MRAGSHGSQVLSPKYDMDHAYQIRNLKSSQNAGQEPSEICNILNSHSRIPCSSVKNAQICTSYLIGKGILQLCTLISILDRCCSVSVQLPPNISTSYRNLSHLETTKLHYPATANSFRKCQDLHFSSPREKCLSYVQFLNSSTWIAPSRDKIQILCSLPPNILLGVNMLISR